MHSLCIILIAGLGCLLGVTNVNDAERNMCVRESEALFEIALYPSLRICAAPYCAKTEVNGTQKDVLDSGGAVLHPVFSHGSG